MRGLAVELTRALKKRLDAPVDVRESRGPLPGDEPAPRRPPHPAPLRALPDEIEVTGLWMEFHNFDLVIVEERAETVQQLVILGHELWHMMAGHSHSHHHYAGAAAAAGALSDEPGWQEIALTVAAHNGSHEADEAEAEDFGLHLASVFRSWVTGPRTKGSLDPVEQAIQASFATADPRTDRR